MTEETVTVFASDIVNDGEPVEPVCWGTVVEGSNGRVIIKLDDDNHSTMVTGSRATVYMRPYPPPGEVQAVMDAIREQYPSMSDKLATLAIKAIDNYRNKEKK